MSHEKKPILRAPRASSAMLPLAILLALVCGALLLALSGYSPIEAYAALLERTDVPEDMAPLLSRS